MDPIITAYAIYLGIALSAGLGLVFCLVVAIQFESRLRHLVTPSIAVLVTLGIAASTIASGRDLKYASLGAIITGSGGSGAALVWGLRFLSVAILGLAVVRLAGHLRSGKGYRNPAQGFALGAFFVFFCSHTVTNALFGSVPAFVHNSFYAGAVFLAAYFSRNDSEELFLDACKYGLHSLMLASILIAFILPSLTVQPSYSGLIPGVDFRLWGLGSHANSIGPLALVALLLEYARPTRQLALRYLFVASSFSVFVLAQSKTVWLVALVICFVLLGYRAVRSVANVLAATVATVFGVVILFVLVGIAAPDVLAKFADIQGLTGGSLSNLSGRAQIWEIVVNEWERNPLFGFGPTFLGVEHRVELGLPATTSAHNQFLQSLSSAGALGAFSLMVYLIALGICAWRSGPRTNGVSVALYMLVLARCATETPLVTWTLFSGELLTHLILFRIAIQSFSDGKFPTPQSGAAILRPA